MSAASTAWRIGRWLLLGIAGLLVLALLALTVLMVTPAGARWAVSTGLSRSPVPVTIGSVTGTLPVSAWATSSAPGGGASP